MIIRILFLSLFFCLLHSPAHCYKENIHNKGTEKAVLASSFPNFLTTFLNFKTDTVFRRDLFEKQTAIDWIVSGGVREDNIPRFLNHFFDPTTEKGATFLFQQNSSREWAKDLVANDWDWVSGRGYFYEALTSSDAYNREIKFATTFRSVGQVMHLVEDLASPAHVRNDVHVPFLPWDKDFYEEFTDEKYNKKDENGINFVPFNGYPPVDLTSFSNFDTFWKNSGKGLSEFTNGNFLSRGTNLDTNTYSSPSAIGEWVAEETPDLKKPPVKVRYAQGYVTDSYRPETSAPINKLASISYYDFEMKKRYSPDKWVYTLNDSVHREYAQFLVPRAVGYAAGILNYFFRGTLNITSVPTDITFRSIKITASNSTPGEAMGIGDVSLVIRYKALSETDLGLGKYRLDNPSADYSYKMATLKDVNLATPQPLTFNFGNTPLPMNFSNMTMQLVFKGKLGNEDGAVAVSKLEPITGIYTDFTLSLPPSGVYAKTSDDSPTANFNELRVTALSDAPGGLTGGSINLALEYRTAIGNQFQSVLVDTEPIDAAGYILKKPEKSGVNTLPQGVPVELVFDLSSLQLPIQATDVELNIVYTNADGSQAIGVRDISEPTPVDVYNNTDYNCLNGTWYKYDDPAAMAIVDSNDDGIADLSDIYPHSINNISFLSGPAGEGTLDANVASTLFASGPLATGQMLRMGYILTDYANRYAIHEIRTGQNGDPWFHPTTNNRIFPGTGFRNDATSWSSMFTFRDVDTKLWWGASVIFINKEYNGTCTWDALNQKLGL